MNSIIIYKDFSEFPGLRHCSLSDNSGEEFYHSVLNLAFYNTLTSKEKITINLDNTAGYAPSFLDEAFGNLVYDFTKDIVLQYLEIISIEEPYWKEMIFNETLEQWENRRDIKKSPKVTKEHSAWYRLVGSKVELQIWEQPLIVK